MDNLVERAAVGVARAFSPGRRHRYREEQLRLHPNILLIASTTVDAFKVVDTFVVNERLLWPGRRLSSR
jgi:hypothetical protein